MLLQCSISIDSETLDCYYLCLLSRTSFCYINHIIRDYNLSYLCCCPFGGSGFRALELKDPLHHGLCNRQECSREVECSAQHSWLIFAKKLGLETGPGPGPGSFLRCPGSLESQRRTSAIQKSLDSQVFWREVFITV